MIFKRKSKNQKEANRKKTKVLTINPRKKLVVFLWCMFIGSFSFAVYKHFTAIDTHTIREQTIVERELRDTNHIENIVRNFAQVYFEWSSSEEALEEREIALEDFLTDDLQTLNSIMIDSDIPTSSSVQNVDIWSINQQTENDFNVTFSVTQRITEDDEEEERTIHSAYELTVHVDEEDNLVITRNPTITSFPSKSAYQPTALESDTSIDSETREDIDEFLSSFFTLYPTASQSELSYYVEDNILPLIDREYTFSELIDPIYIEEGGNVRVVVTVRYQDDLTQVDQLSQYELLLYKNGTWKIIDN